MKANKKHISLENAKLLKDCGVESKNYYIIENSFTDPVGVYKSPITVRKEDEVYPAYTWQEILWENAKKFFKSEEDLSGIPNEQIEAINILVLLQQGKYQQADEYFRKHNKLIK